MTRRTLTWSDTYAIVAVPEGAASGPLRITNSQSGLSDATDDARGLKFDPFTVNDTTYPGLCGLVPPSGYIGESFKAVGQGNQLIVIEVMGVHLYPVARVHLEFNLYGHLPPARL